MGGGEGGGGDADGVGACIGVVGRCGGTKQACPAEVVFEVGVGWVAGWGGGGVGKVGAASK